MEVKLDCLLQFTNLAFISSFTALLSQYYAKLGCASTGGLRLSSYSDASCTKEINTNLGLYNDIKVR